MINKDNEKSKGNMDKGQIISPKKRKKTGAQKVSALLDCIKVLKEEKFTGYIKVNFTQGSIARVEKFEEILKH
ncbi:hypothetical protein JXL19_12105 [bacterium]|nr:hypothetical protein [bacterium]